jgi:ABC-type sugar transport system substrate-binding protein
MRRRSFPKHAALGGLFATVLTLSGCDWGSPPATATVANPTDEVPPESALYITLILPEERSPAMDAYEQEAAIAAGMEKALFRLEHPEPGTPPSRQVELIEKAVADGATAILILPQDPKIVATALAKARDKGVSVVVLNRLVEVEGTPLTLVTQAPIEESVRPMLEAVMAGAKEFKLSPEGPAVLVVNHGSGEAEATARAAGLRKALTAAGVSDIFEVEFKEHVSQPDEIYREVLDRSPRPSMIFATDDGSISSLARARAADIEFNPNAPVLGALVTLKRSFDLIEYNQVVSEVDMRIKPLVEKAIRVAIDQTRGESIKTPVVVERPVHVASDLHNPRAFSEPLSSDAKDPGKK